MGMKGLVCALSPARLKILDEDPEIVNDLADREVEVPGRAFFDAARMPKRLRARLPTDALLILDCLEGKVGRGIGDEDGWAFGRPHVIEGDELGGLGAALSALKEMDDSELDEDPDRMSDDAFLMRLTELVKQETARGGALLVFIT